MGVAVELMKKNGHVVDIFLKAKIRELTDRLGM